MSDNRKRSTAGKAAADYIARWDRASWTAMTPGITGKVDKMVMDGNGILYATGAFTGKNPFDSRYIAAWDGSQWLSLGKGPGGLPPALAVDYNGNLYASGVFHDNTSDPHLYSLVARDGTEWKLVRPGADNIINTFAIGAEGEIYLGGAFSTAGANISKYIACRSVGLNT